jgi:hypothetical protein
VINFGRARFAAFLVAPDTALRQIAPMMSSCDSLQSLIRPVFERRQEWPRLRQDHVKTRPG